MPRDIQPRPMGIAPWQSKLSHVIRDVLSHREKDGEDVRKGGLT